MAGTLVTELPLLSSQECDAVHRAVQGMAGEWQQRDPQLPFFTLGAASYLDAARGRYAAYQAKARRLNVLMWEQFGWLLRRLAASLGRVLGREVFFDDRLALPGFHLFLAHPALALFPASAHFDLQHQLIDWSGFDLGGDGGHLSLTLAVKVPACGTGLRVWGINYLEWQPLDAEQRREYAGPRRRPDLHRYTQGRLYLHSGYQLHQIAPPCGQLQRDDVRLTLQAHARPVRHGYVLYW